MYKIKIFLVSLAMLFTWAGAQASVDVDIGAFGAYDYASDQVITQARTDDVAAIEKSLLPGEPVIIRACRDRDKSKPQMINSRNRVSLAVAHRYRKLYIDH